MKMNNHSPDFLVTKEYKRFKEFCDACRRDKYIGLCYGPPGVGKTLSALNYSSWDIITQYYKSRDVFKPPTAPIPAEIQEYKTLFYTPDVANSPSRISAELNKIISELQHIQYELEFYELAKSQEYTDKEYNNMRFLSSLEASSVAELLIIDESDRLKLASLEQVRDYYDRHECGLVLIGMPGMEKKLSRYAQLYSRIGFVHEFRPLSQDEIIFIMSNHLQTIGLSLNPEDFTDHETITTIIQTTRGNFRLLNRLFRQIKRIMAINQIRTITKEIVYAARECLVIGN